MKDGADYAKLSEFVQGMGVREWVVEGPGYIRLRSECIGP